MATGEDSHGAHDSEYEDLDIPDEEDCVGGGDSVSKWQSQLHLSFWNSNLTGSGGDKTGCYWLQFKFL